MNSRDRVLTALKHEEPDRVPCDYWGSPETTDNLYSHLNIESYELLLRKLSVDVRYVKPSYECTEFREQPDGSLHRRCSDGKYIDIWGIVRKKISIGKSNYLEVEESPLANAATVKEVADYKFPNPDNFDYQSMVGKCQRYKDYAIICTGDRLTTRASIFKMAMYLRGMENLLMDLAINPRIVEALINKLLEFHLEHNRRIFEEASDKVDIFMLGDDFGTQDGPMISRDMFCKLFKPALKKLIDLGHKFGLKVMLHSCGSIKLLIPEFINIGLDILNPIQTKAKNMDPKELKKEFGSDLCFHGSVDVQTVIPFGTLGEVKKEVKKSIDALASGGGFILSPTHNIQPDAPVENITALYETAQKEGGYKKEAFE